MYKVKYNKEKEMEKVIERLNSKKENIIVYSIILLLSVILCFNFIKFHTVPDTYVMLVEEGYNCTRYFNEGRIVTALFLYFGYLLNIPLKIMTIFMSIVSIFCLSMSVYIIYNVFAKKEDGLFKKCIMLVGSYLVIFNPLSIEHLAYVESGIICLGTLLCVLSAKMLVVDHKEGLPIIMVCLAAICYQGVINVFITISALFIIFDESKWKEKIKLFVWVCLICIIALFVNVLIIKIANYKMDVKTTRDLGIDFSQNLAYISGLVLMHDWHLYPKYFIFYVIVASVLALLLNKEYKCTLKYLLTVLIAILSCSIPSTFIKEMNMGMAARTITAVGSIVGISIITCGGGKKSKQNLCRFDVMHYFYN